MISEHISDLQATLSTIGDHEQTIARLAQSMENGFRNGRKLLTCGNGGSSAEAAHLAEEFTGRFWRERSSLPGMCLSIDGTALTCIGNDYGFDDLFSRQVSSLAMPGDFLAGFSTSGNSENVYRAFIEAKKRGVVTILFGGKSGGRMKGMTDYEIIVASDSTMRVQECHLFLVHMLCEAVERLYLGLDR